MAVYYPRDISMRPPNVEDGDPWPHFDLSKSSSELAIIVSKVLDRDLLHFSSTDYESVNAAI